MRLLELTLVNYKIFIEEKFKLNGKSTVIFGINGMGKSTILSAINYLNRVWINRLNPAQGKAFQSFSDDMITIGRSELFIQGEIELNGNKFSLLRYYERKKRNPYWIFLIGFGKSMILINCQL